MRYDMVRLPSSPERLARLGLRLFARDADIGEHAVVEFEQTAALLLPVVEPEQLSKRSDSSLERRWNLNRLKR